MTPETLVRHELAGLPVEVTASPNADLVGLSGRVVDETTNTLLVEPEPADPGADTDASRVRQVPKAAATFAFALDTAATDTDGSAVVTVAGERLVARPARRTETTGDSPWR